ncbi:sensor histidine kinase [Luteitalea sp. TBR-22]|uniref:sensor histidine kinase n=1 Tax=Luteitalea sp. TBR-22 TaxID=2802971 RepID=UPI001AF9C011|nr:ATP-binding protein [Luteitalea sp. TBR-22]BCS34513.1 sensor histidine kinase [Luteitalea sp. TBR-22]
MSPSELVDQLTTHTVLSAAPREELAWLADHGVVRQLATGDVLSARDATVAGMYVLLAGHIAMFVQRPSGREKTMEWRTGDVLGALPYSRLSSPPGDTIAQEPSTLLAIDRSLFPALIGECHQVTAILVHRMVDRARLFTSSDLRTEKMASLGKLSAGLAHELNNPAAAIERSAAVLDDRLAQAERATRVLCKARLDEEQLAAIEAMRSSCLASRAGGVLSPLQRAEREETLADWLAAHALDETLSPLLAETAVTLDALDRIAGQVDGDALDAVLRWAAAGCAVRELASEIQEAAMRITGLVQAVKGFTHMDQATMAEPLDLPTNLANTVTVLKSKARRKEVAVAIDVEPGLPRVLGFVGELNQVWSNLIDNALDAVATGGRIDVTARCESTHVVVRVIDDGPGIQPDVQARIFEPFFSTKPVGQGTGLGLDIVRRLLQHNDATIEVESVPGRTEFRVRLRVAAAPMESAS